MKNYYKLYEVNHLKGMMMYKYITEIEAYNIIEAEDFFEGSNFINVGYEYVITIKK